MKKINSRSKGAAGEREFCRWLEENLDIELPERNLDQTRSGGADIICVWPFYFEVKRCEKLELFKWWKQVMKASEHDDEIIPVVCFRQNRSPWEFLIPASLINVQRGYLRVSSRIFLAWVENSDITVRLKI